MLQSGLVHLREVPPMSRSRMVESPLPPEPRSARVPLDLGSVRAYGRCVGRWLPARSAVVEAEMRGLGREGDEVRLVLGQGVARAELIRLAGSFEEVRTLALDILVAID